MADIVNLRLNRLYKREVIILLCHFENSSVDSTRRLVSKTESLDSNPGDARIFVIKLIKRPV